MIQGDNLLGTIEMFMLFFLKDLIHTQKYIYIYIFSTAFKYIKTMIQGDNLLGTIEMFMVFFWKT